MLIDAMKSAGPKMIVSTRGEACAIAFTLVRPSAFSICASMPIRPGSYPCTFSNWVSSRSSATTCSAVCTFGSMMQSRLAPAPPTTSITSAYVHSVVQSFTRTTRSLLPQPPSFSAATMFFRASTLAIGATESSRSRNTWSASSPFALARNRGIDPGVARHDRRLRKTCSVVCAAIVDLHSVTHRSPAAYGETPATCPVTSLTVTPFAGGHRAGCDGDRRGDEEGRTRLAGVERRTAGACLVRHGRREVPRTRRRCRRGGAAVARAGSGGLGRGRRTGQTGDQSAVELEGDGTTAGAWDRGVDGRGPGTADRAAQRGRTGHPARAMEDRGGPACAGAHRRDH